MQLYMWPSAWWQSPDSIWQPLFHIMCMSSGYMCHHHSWAILSSLWNSGTQHTLTLNLEIQWKLKGYSNPYLAWLAFWWCSSTGLYLLFINYDNVSDGVILTGSFILKSNPEQTYRIYNQPDTISVSIKISIHFSVCIMINMAQGKWGLNNDYKLSGELMTKADGYTMTSSSMYNNVNLSE